eukprot:scaffold21054_cov15-Tisochrysis_lutea.AAC.2
MLVCTEWWGVRPCCTCRNIVPGLELVLLVQAYQPRKLCVHQAKPGTAAAVGATPPLSRTHQQPPPEAQTSQQPTYLGYLLPQVQHSTNAVLTPPSHANQPNQVAEETLSTSAPGATPPPFTQAFRGFEEEGAAEPRDGAADHHHVHRLSRTWSAASPLHPQGPLLQPPMPCKHHHRRHRLLQPPALPALDQTAASKYDKGEQLHQQLQPSPLHQQQQQQQQQHQQGHNELQLSSAHQQQQLEQQQQQPQIQRPSALSGRSSLEGPQAGGHRSSLEHSRSSL